jgi:hypothetical protein
VLSYNLQVMLETFKIQIYPLFIRNAAGRRHVG